MTVIICVVLIRNNKNSTQVNSEFKFVNNHWHPLPSWMQSVDAITTIVDAIPCKQTLGIHRMIIKTWKNILWNLLLKMRWCLLEKMSHPRGCRGWVAIAKLQRCASKNVSWPEVTLQWINNYTDPFMQRSIHEEIHSRRDPFLQIYIHTEIQSYKDSFMQRSNHTGI